MKKIHYIAATLLLLGCFSCEKRVPQKFTLEEGAKGQLESFVENLQGRDSVLIADQLRYGAFLGGIPYGSRIAMPRGSTIQGFETIADWKLDTVEDYGRDSLMDIRAYTTITCFEEGEYQLPGFEIDVWRGHGKTDSLSFSGQDVLVCTVPVDTATFVAFDLKEQRTIPVQTREWLPWLAGGLAFLAAVALGIFFLVRWSRKKRGVVFQDPPYIVALRKLDSFRDTGNWEPDKQKTFYSGVTDALREYISKRFCIGAMEMTTAEIMSALKKEDLQDELKGKLKELLENADAVKFAKAVFDDDENAKVVPNSVRFVMTTYQQQLEQEQEQKQKMEQKRKKGGVKDGI